MTLKDQIKNEPHEDILTLKSELDNKDIMLDYLLPPLFEDDM
jgi:hypothetical protein